MPIFGEKQQTFFGDSRVNGSRNVTALMHRFVHEGHDVGVSRMLALFHYETMKQFLFEISENNYGEDELDAKILEVSRENHSLIESIARMKRKMMEEGRIAIRTQIDRQHNEGWYMRYLDTERWRWTKSQAEATRQRMDRCVFDHRHPRHEWHHPTYDYLGLDEDVNIIQPICMSCHEAAHFGNKASLPLECPPHIRELIQL